MKDIYIVGAGGFGREVEWLLNRINLMSSDAEPVWNILGYIDDSAGEENLVFEKVRGNLDWLLAYNEPVNVVVAIGSSAARKVIVERLRENSNLSFPNIIDPSVYLCQSIKMGKGNIICAGTICTVDIAFGDFCIINLDCTIGHDAEFGNFVTLYPSVNVSGRTAFGDCTELGTGTQIIQGLTIKEGTIVGAGAVVCKDLPANCTAVGVPAKPIRFR